MKCGERIKRSRIFHAIVYNAITGNWFATCIALRFPRTSPAYLLDRPRARGTRFCATPTLMLDLKVVEAKSLSASISTNNSRANEYNSVHLRISQRTHFDIRIFVVAPYIGGKTRIRPTRFNCANRRAVGLNNSP